MTMSLSRSRRRAPLSDSPITGGTSPAVGPELSQSLTLRRLRVVAPGLGSCSATWPASMVAWMRRSGSRRAVSPAAASLDVASSTVCPVTSGVGTSRVRIANWSPARAERPNVAASAPVRATIRTDLTT